MRSPVPLALVVPLCAALLACGSGEAPSSTPSAEAKGKSERAEQAEASEGAAGDASAAAAKGGAAPPDAKPKFPPEARRDAPPPDLLANAVKVGAQAPTFTLEGSTGSVTLGDALGKADYVVLVFYRGGW